MVRILVADKLADDGLELLRSESGIETIVRTNWAAGELAGAAREADGLIVRSGVQVTAECLTDPGRLRAVARAGVGVDNIDVAAATCAGVLVMNTPDANTLSTAEHTLAMMLALSRLIVPASAHVKGGGWQRAKYQGVQLAGKTLGIVGLGRVGRAVAARALSFEMRVLAFDPFFRGATAMEDRVTLVGSAMELFRQCDFVTLHAALTDANKRLVNAEVLANARPGLRLVNCARGELVDEAALADALRGGRLAGAAIDVFTTEPPAKDHPLLSLENVICTPHLGASTAEAQTAVSVEAAQAMIDYLLRGQVRGAVNIADLPRDMSPRDAAYADLATRLGTLLSVLCPDGVDRVSITTHGDGLSKLSGALRRYVTAALLGPYFNHRLNIVNADAVAAEHGIDVRHVAHGQARGITDHLHVAVESGNTRHEVEATVFVDGLPRLLRVDGYRMNIEAAGQMVLIFNDDRPGVIGLVGTVFGRHAVNIADMALSRHERRALMVLRLDDAPPPECMAELRTHPAILAVHSARIGG